MKELVKEYLDKKYEKVKTIKITEDKEICILKDKETGVFAVEKNIKRECKIYKELKNLKADFFPQIYY